MRSASDHVRDTDLHAIYVDFVFRIYKVNSNNDVLGTGT